MREIRFKPIAVFFALFIPTLVASVGITAYLSSLVDLGGYEGVAGVLLCVTLIFTSNLLVHRIFLSFMPLAEGECAEGSREEFIYHVYVLYYLLIFHSPIVSYAIPVPIMRLVYLLLGAKLGEVTYSAGVLLDPSLVEIGSHTIVGYDSVLCPHAVEGRRILFKKIKVGSHVTIGMKSMIMAGVIIENDAIVAAGSVVTKDTQIKAGETWGGTPARRLRGPSGESAVEKNSEVAQLRPQSQPRAISA